MENKKEKNILLIIDPQVGFNRPSSQHVFPVIEKIIPLFNELLITTFINPEGSMLKTEKDWHRFDNQHLQDRELAIKIPPSIEKKIFPLSVDNKIIELNGLSPLADYLKEQELRTIFVCGVSSDCSILDTARGLFDLGIKPIIIENACASNKDEKHHLAAMLLLRRHPGGKFIISSQDLPSYLV